MTNTTRHLSSELLRAGNLARSLGHQANDLSKTAAFMKKESRPQLAIDFYAAADCLRKAACLLNTASTSSDEDRPI